MSMIDDNPCIDWERMKEAPYTDEAIKWAVTHLNDRSNGPEYAAWCRQVIEWVVAERGALLGAVRQLHADLDAAIKTADDQRALVSKYLAEVGAGVVAHHAALRANEELRKDRDDACERASRLSRQLVEADLEIKRLENAKGLWKQRAELLKEKYLSFKQVAGAERRELQREVEQERARRYATNPPVLWIAPHAARDLVRAADERTVLAVTKRLAAEQRVRELEAALTALKTVG